MFKLDKPSFVDKANANSMSFKAFGQKKKRMEVDLAADNAEGWRTRLKDAFLATYFSDPAFCGPPLARTPSNPGSDRP